MMVSRLLTITVSGPIIRPGDHVVACPDCGMVVHYAGKLLSYHEVFNGCLRITRQVDTARQSSKKRRKGRAAGYAAQQMSLFG